jgi:hypothetical protein
MKSKRTIILLVLFVAVSALSAARYALKQPHPESLAGLRAGHDDYKPLMMDGAPVPGWVTYRMENGLLIHLEEKGDVYEPKIGVYTNADGARVHVQLIEGFVAVHTHGYIPEYELGTANLHGIDCKIVQLPPDHVDLGPSRFVVRFSRKVKEGRFLGRVEHGERVVMPEIESRVVNSRNRLLSFDRAYPEYPEGAEIRVRLEMNGKSEDAHFPLHELPPRETLSRSLVRKINPGDPVPCASCSIK